MHRKREHPKHHITHHLPDWLSVLVAILLGMVIIAGVKLIFSGSLKITGKGFEQWQAGMPVGTPPGGMPTPEMPGSFQMPQGFPPGASQDQIPPSQMPEMPSGQMPEDNQAPGGQILGTTEGIPPITPPDDGVGSGTGNADSLLNVECSENIRLNNDRLERVKCSTIYERDPTLNLDVSRIKCGDYTIIDTAGRDCLGNDAMTYYCCVPKKDYVYPCGNGILEGGEECDDGNTDDEDGCSSQCKKEVCEIPPCPNGKLVEVPCNGGNNQDTPQVTGAASLEHPKNCKCYECRKETCDDAYGKGNWQECPPGSGGAGTQCCAKDATCNSEQKNVPPACCPKGTIPKGTLFAGGVNYCEKTDSFCKGLYGEGFYSCGAACCSSTEKCIGTIIKRCVNENQCSPPTPFECEKYGFFDEDYLCCEKQSECKTLSGEKVCIPEADSCNPKEQWCPGKKESAYQDTATCCPAGSACFAHPDGSPICIK